MCKKKKSELYLPQVPECPVDKLFGTFQNFGMYSEKVGLGRVQKIQ